MTLILKKKTATDEVTVPVSDLSEHSTAIDALGKLMSDLEKAEAALMAKAKAEIEKVQTLQAKIAADTAKLVKDLNEEADEKKIKDDDKTFVAKGTKFQMRLSAKGTSRAIADMEKIKELMDKQDKTLFMKVVKMDLKSVDSYLTIDERALVLKSTRTPRTAKIEKKV